MDNLWLKVENMVTKWEIACFVQFLLLSLCFQISCLLQRRQKASIWGKGLICTTYIREEKMYEIVIQCSAYAEVDLLQPIWRPPQYDMNMLLLIILQLFGDTLKNIMTRFMRPMYCYFGTFNNLVKQMIDWHF